MLTDAQARERIVSLAVTLYDHINLLYRYEYHLKSGCSPAESLRYSLSKTVSDGRPQISTERR